MCSHSHTYISHQTTLMPTLCLLHSHTSTPTWCSHNRLTHACAHTHIHTLTDSWLPLIGGQEAFPTGPVYMLLSYHPPPGACRSNSLSLKPSHTIKEELQQARYRLGEIPSAPSGHGSRFKSVCPVTQQPGALASGEGLAGSTGVIITLYGRHLIGQCRTSSALDSKGGSLLCTVSLAQWF
jgi:hypothetical protein